MGIDMVRQLWLDFNMHKALSIKWRKNRLKEKRMDEEFNVIGTHVIKIQESRSL